MAMTYFSFSSITKIHLFSMGNLTLDMVLSTFLRVGFGQVLLILVVVLIILLATRMFRNKE